MIFSLLRIECFCVIKGQKPDVKAVRQAILSSSFPCNPDEVSTCQPYLKGTLNVDGAWKQLETPTNVGAGIRAAEDNISFNLSSNLKQRGPMKEMFKGSRFRVINPEVSG